MSTQIEVLAKNNPEVYEANKAMQRAALQLLLSAVNLAAKLVVLLVTAKLEELDDEKAIS